MEFKEHVARLANGGDPIAAYKCWMRGVEILQSPFFVPTTSELEELPPTLEALCSQHPCHHTLAASSSCDGAEVSLFRQGHGLAMVGILIDGPRVLVALLGAQWKHRMWHPYSWYGLWSGRIGTCVSPPGATPEAEFSSAGGRWHSFSNCPPI